MPAAKPGVAEGMDGALWADCSPRTDFARGPIKNPKIKFKRRRVHHLCDRISQIFHQHFRGTSGRGGLFRPAENGLKLVLKPPPARAGLEGKEITMMRFGILAASSLLALGVAGPVLAQTDVQNDRQDIRQDRQDIRQNTQDQRQNRQDERQNRGDIRGDHQDINQDQHALDRAQTNGNTNAAQGIRSDMRKDRQDIRNDKQDTRSDRQDARGDRQDSRSDRQDIRNDRQDIRNDK
ncbi:MAG TPA: hypothetical protein VH722_07525 [Alphaproteobacteria bacterium]|nr:hypothetical protein [Alphaproteobacteria bacterium]